MSCFTVLWNLCSHDIQKEIPPRQQALAFGLHRTWQFLVVGGGFLQVLASLATGLLAYSSFPAEAFGWSIFYFVAVGFFSFFLWFKPGYKALQSNSGLYFAIFFVSMSCHLVLVIFQILSFSRAASFPGLLTNFWSLTDYFKFNQQASGIISIVMVVIWVMTGVTLMRRMYVEYRKDSTSRQGFRGAPPVRQTQV